jgi:hypothetical protein
VSMLNCCPIIPEAAVQSERIMAYSSFKRGSRR